MKVKKELSIRTINVVFTVEEYAKIKKRKGTRTWRQFIMELGEDGKKVHQVEERDA